MLALQRINRVVQLHFLKRFSSSSLTAAAKLSNDSVEENTQKKTNSMVAAAFALLKEENSDKKVNKFDKNNENTNTNIIDERIINAKSVNSLLSVSEGNVKLTRKQALKIVSVLAEWSTINRAKLSEFESDNRFLKLCRILGRSVPKNGHNSNELKDSSLRTDDLNTVLSIAGDDEAAKLIASINLPQMVKVITSLAQKKRRSTPLLRSLAFNISSSPEQLDLKQCADVLYAMACLNFPDTVLTAKICADVQSTLEANKDKPAVVGSILTSLSLLKYRDLDVLDLLSKWVLQHSNICRPQDICAMFLTHATLHYKMQEQDDIISKIINNITEADFSKKTDWLDYVWSLTLLKLCKNKHINSVLSETFLEQMEREVKGLTPNSKRKLLNINAYAKTVDKYEGPLLKSNSDIFSVPLVHCKSKQVLLNAVLDALKSLMKSGTYVKTLVDTQMGFLIDAQCMFDTKRNPLPTDKEHQNAIKVAIMVVDFHDTCKGIHKSITGLTSFTFDVLEKNGYKILPVPYNEFSISDKILKRVQYLEKGIKELVSPKS